MNRITCSILLAILLFHAPLTSASDRMVLPVQGLPEFTIPKGRILYQRYCLFCHGENGAGDGQNAFSLPNRPADLSQVVARRSQEQLIAAIKGDGAEDSRGSMPSFGRTLSDPEISQLIEFISNVKAKQRIPAGDMDL